MITHVEKQINGLAAAPNHVVLRNLDLLQQVCEKLRGFRKLKMSIIPALIRMEPVHPRIASMLVMMVWDTVCGQNDFCGTSVLKTLAAMEQREPLFLERDIVDDLHSPLDREPSQISDTESRVVLAAMVQISTTLAQISATIGPSAENGMRGPWRVSASEEKHADVAQRGDDISHTLDRLVLTRFAALLLVDDGVFLKAVCNQAQKGPDLAKRARFLSSMESALIDFPEVYCAFFRLLCLFPPADKQGLHCYFDPWKPGYEARGMAFILDVLDHGRNTELSGLMPALGLAVGMLHTLDKLDFLSLFNSSCKLSPVSCFSYLIFLVADAFVEEPLPKAIGKAFKYFELPPLPAKSFDLEPLPEKNADSILVTLCGAMHMILDTIDQEVAAIAHIQEVFGEDSTKLTQCLLDLALAAMVCVLAVMEFGPIRGRDKGKVYRMFQTLLGGNYALSPWGRLVSLAVDSCMHSVRYLEVFEPLFEYLLADDTGMAYMRVFVKRFHSQTPRLMGLGGRVFEEERVFLGDYGWLYE